MFLSRRSNKAMNVMGSYGESSVFWREWSTNKSITFFCTLHVVKRHSRDTLEMQQSTFPFKFHTAPKCISVHSFSTTVLLWSWAAFCRSNRCVYHPYDAQSEVLNITWLSLVLFLVVDKVGWLWEDPVRTRRQYPKGRDQIVWNQATGKTHGTFMDIVQFYHMGSILIV